MSTSSSEAAQVISGAQIGAGVVHNLELRRSPRMPIYGQIIQRHSVRHRSGSPLRELHQACHPEAPPHCRLGDPNDLIGPLGDGSDAHWLTGVAALPYIVFFENKPEATAAARTVTITQQLDPAKVDLNTFRFGPISFGDTLVTPPAALTTYSTIVDLRPANNVLVQITAELDTSSGVLRYFFDSLDPTTGQPPADPFAGFLPPNTVPPNGQGSVAYSVQPRPGLTSGVSITNQASIVFDTNPPILTGTWLNHIDKTVPASNVAPLVATQSGKALPSNGAATTPTPAFRTTTFLYRPTAGHSCLSGRTPATLPLSSPAAAEAATRFIASPPTTPATEAAPGGADANTATPVAPPALANISTRVLTQTGKNVLIGGFIITGNAPKRLIVRAVGQSLSAAGVARPLLNPRLTLFNAGGTIIGENDDWGQTQRPEIEDSGFAPGLQREPAIIQTLAPGAYTAIVSGADKTKASPWSRSMISTAPPLPDGQHLHPRPDRNPARRHRSPASSPRAAIRSASSCAKSDLRLAHSAWRMQCAIRWSHCTTAPARSLPRT